MILTRPTSARHATRQTTALKGFVVLSRFRCDCPRRDFSLLSRFVALSRIGIGICFNGTNKWFGRFVALVAVAETDRLSNNSYRSVGPPLKSGKAGSRSPENAPTKTLKILPTGEVLATHG